MISLLISNLYKLTLHNTISFADCIANGNEIDFEIDSDRKKLVALLPNGLKGKGDDEIEVSINYEYSSTPLFNKKQFKLIEKDLNNLEVFNYQSPVTFKKILLSLENIPLGYLLHYEFTIYERQFSNLKNNEILDLNHEIDKVKFKKYFNRTKIENLKHKLNGDISDGMLEDSFIFEPEHIVLCENELTIRDTSGFYLFDQGRIIVKCGENVWSSRNFYSINYFGDIISFQNRYLPNVINFIDSYMNVLGPKHKTGSNVSNLLKGITTDETEKDSSTVKPKTAEEKITQETPKRSETVVYEGETSPVVPKIEEIPITAVPNQPIISKRDTAPPLNPKSDITKHPNTVRYINQLQTHSSEEMPSVTTQAETSSTQPVKISKNDLDILWIIIFISIITIFIIGIGMVIYFYFKNRSNSTRST